MRTTLIVVLTTLLTTPLLPVPASAAPTGAEVGPVEMGTVEMGPVEVGSEVGAEVGGGPVAEHLLRQRIDWTPCAEPDLAGLECGAYRTPRDWGDPEDSRTITIAVSRLRNDDARRSVLTNPGGPGGQGRFTPLMLQGRQRLVESAELIGFDVRGAGASTNLTCGNLNWRLVADPRDRSRANVERLYDAAELQARTCQTLSGDLHRVVNTEQTARDLDLLRHLLGRDRVDWVGYSSGTWLGAHYATLFPKRVGRFVLDSNADLTARFQTMFHDYFAQAFQRRFDVDYLPWVAKHHDAYGLGRTAGEVKRVYEAVRAKLAEAPFILPDGTVLDAIAFDQTAFQTQYRKLLFPMVTPDLADLARRLGVVAPEPQSASGPRLAASDFPTLTTLTALASRYPDAENATLFAVACNDTPFHGGRADLARDAERTGSRYPFFGYHQLLAPCAFWKRPPLTLPKPTGEGAPPLLLVQSERDPATPVEGARRSHKILKGSRMLTVLNEGDHGMYAVGNNPCVDREVEDFLVDGKIPERDLTCSGTALPIPNELGTVTTALPALIGFPL
ncbi:alpha/beta hydrolase [Actinosynnema mirum]|uniref:TAP domain protein n=1 Tax=Actinosynnema mirum (strain ATCC 29888 / DSM 43827 / JCM 3225 / NBRC 14064 / NCIMB 13271 / NRRL B-12336 / IMRU 3971 / 101) TaxID=446462 RepID=C6WGE0_ACTMD|nr:alpha/beta hydrolase [Actinosynnema mirum]ACU39904.1 TAP domain protein [Actinosynnema mirum DSM 43827]